MKDSCVLFVVSLLLSISGKECATPPLDMINALPNHNPFSGEMEDLEFRVHIDAYKVECFHQNVRKEHNLEISYRVIEMSPRWQWLYVPSNVRDLTIDFVVRDTRGNVVIEEHDKQEGSHTHEVKEDGVYTICFDNSRSSVSTKSVNLEVYLYSLEDDDRWGYFDEDFTFPPDVQYEDSIETIKTSVNRVRDNLIKVVHHQNERQAIEKRDRNIAEQNYNYVTNFSLLSVTLMLLVGFSQIMLIRSLFDEKSFLKRIFQKKF